MKAGTAARLGKKDATLASVDKMMALAPNHPVNFYNRACMYCLLGDKANALADLKKAIGKNPGFKQSAGKDKD